MFICIFGEYFTSHSLGSADVICGSPHRRHVHMTSWKLKLTPSPLVCIFTQLSLLSFLSASDFGIPPAPPCADIICTCPLRGRTAETGWEREPWFSLAWRTSLSLFPPSFKRLNAKTWQGDGDGFNVPRWQQKQLIYVDMFCSFLKYNTQHHGSVEGFEGVKRQKLWAKLDPVTSRKITRYPSAAVTPPLCGCEMCISPSWKTIAP